MKSLKIILAISAVAMALSSTAQAETYEVTLGAGSEGLTYDRAMNVAADALKSSKKADFEVGIENYGGSDEIIQAFQDEEIDAGIAQVEAFVLFPPSRQHKLVKAHDETLHWLYNRKHDVDDFGDISKGEAIAVVAGSGTLLTLKNFANEDSGYERYTVDGKGSDKHLVLVDSLEDGLDIVAIGNYNGKKIVGLMTVTKSLSYRDHILPYAKDIALGDVVDKDFNDTEYNGTPVYTKVKLPVTDRYRPMMNDKVTTLTVPNYGFIAKNVTSNKKADRAFVKAVRKGINSVK